MYLEQMSAQMTTKAIYRDVVFLASSAAAYLFALFWGGGGGKNVSAPSVLDLRWCDPGLGKGHTPPILDGVSS